MRSPDLIRDDDPPTLADYFLGIARDAKAWRERWPHHCTACHGWGGSTYQESHGLPGVGETVFDLCCAPPDARTCHRCGALGLTEDMEGPCTACGWNFDDGEPMP